MKTNKEIGKEFRKRFVLNFEWLIEHSAGDYGIDAPGFDEIEDWLTQTLEAVRKEEREEAVKAERSKVLIELMSLPKISFPADKKLNGLYVEWSDINRLLN